MSVIVKGMKMPQGSCEWVDAEGHLHRCKLLNGDDDCKMQEGICADATWEEQFAGCPLVEIPIQPEIVRCGECKHLMPNGRCEEFADYLIKPSASDFCSYGERGEWTT